MAQLEILVLGVASGSGNTYRRECSSSFLILRDGAPWCLVDLGFGVTYALSKAGFALPDRILITHNHSDHAGELPVILRSQHAKGRRLTVISQSDVERRLKEHRMAEHAELFAPEDLAEWVRVHDGGLEIDGLTLRMVRATHSELCYGFTLSDAAGDCLLGYSADSGADAALYDKILLAKVALIDARPKGNAWHADFADVTPHLRSGCYIMGHGFDTPHDVPSDASHLPLLFPGARIRVG